MKATEITVPMPAHATIEMKQSSSETESPKSVAPEISKNGHTSPLLPDRILQLGTGFFAAKTVLSAAELGLFTELAKGPLDAETLRVRLGLHPRSARDFFDALVALK